MQGEGSRTGVPCVFVRLSGCNLWAGTPSTRDAGTGSCALWCDTDFHSGQKMEPAQVVDAVLGYMRDWPAPAVVISGGEPCLQLRRSSGEQLVSLLQGAGVHVAVETNGTIPADVLGQCDHVTVSPKQLRALQGDDTADRLAHVLVRAGTDLKVVMPQWSQADLQRMTDWDFDHRFIQPLDDGSGHVRAAHDALVNAGSLGWRVSLQTHKLVEMA